MPIKKAAMKSLRQDVRRTRRNMIAKAEIHSLQVKLRKLLGEKQADKALEVARQLGKKLDKAQAHGVMKKNTVGRTKSRMMKNVNALKKA